MSVIKKIKNVPNKKMMCAFVVIWSAIVIVGNLIIHQMLAPDYATELALQQMNEDGSRSKLIVFEHLTNWFSPLMLVIGLTVGIGIWIHENRKVRRLCETIEADEST